MILSFEWPQDRLYYTSPVHTVQATPEDCRWERKPTRVNRLSTLENKNYTVETLLQEPQMARACQCNAPLLLVVACTGTSCCCIAAAPAS